MSKFSSGTIEKKKKEKLIIVDEERRGREGACQPFNGCGFNNRIRNNVSRPRFNYDRSSELLDCSATYSALILNTRRIPARKWTRNCGFRGGNPLLVNCRQTLNGTQRVFRTSTRLAVIRFGANFHPDFHINRGQGRSFDTANIGKTNEIFLRENVASMNSMNFINITIEREWIEFSIETSTASKDQRGRERRNRDELKEGRLVSARNHK